MAQHFVVWCCVCGFEIGVDPGALYILDKDSAVEVCSQPFALFWEQFCYLGQPDFKLYFPTCAQTNTYF